MHAVDPASQHGHLGSGVYVGVVSCILEVLKGYSSIGFGSVEVFRDASHQKQFASARIIHLDANGSKGAIVASDDMRAGSPSPRIGSDGIAEFIGAINESVVFPSVAPRVCDNPGAYLILSLLSADAISVEVEFYSVVVSADGKGMIISVAPRFHIFHSRYSRKPVGWRGGNSSPRAVGSHTDAGNASCRQRSVATMVVEPFFQFLSSFGSIGRSAHAEASCRAVPHCRVPFIISLHPAEIVIVARLVSEKSRIGSSPVGCHVGHAVGSSHYLLVGVVPREEPREVGRQLVLRQRGIGVAIAVELVGKHIADVLSRAARASVLVDDGGEILGFGVVDMIGKNAWHSSLPCCVGSSDSIGRSHIVSVRIIVTIEGCVHHLGGNGYHVPRECQKGDDR